MTNVRIWTRAALAFVAAEGLMGAGVLAADPPATAPASQSASTEASWPQWRGPDRDGIAAGNQKLADSWPEKGPPELWRSTEKIPSGRDGGCGSVTVAGGKAFLFAHFNAPKAKLSISTADLAGWGWSPTMPADLVKKVEDIYGPLRKKYWDGPPPAAETDKLVKDLLATLDAAQAKEFGPAIEKRLTKGFIFSWHGLAEMTTIENKEFDSFGAMAGAIKYTDEAGKAVWGDLFHPHNVMGGVVKSHLLAKCFGWSDVIYCLDAATGKTLWKKEFPGIAASSATYYFAASCTPAVADGLCYVIGSGGFYCLDVKTGEPVWQAKTGYSNSSPFVKNGVVYVMAPALTAFDAKTGKQLWANPKLTSFTSSVVPWSAGGKDYLVGVSRFEVFCAKPDTGEAVWTAFISKGANDSTPVIIGDTLVARAYGGMPVFALTAEKAKPLWAAKEACGDRGSTPVVYQDHVYIIGSMYGVHAFCCLDLKTGEIKWKQDFVGNETFSPVLADGKLFAHVRATKDAPTCSTIMYRATPEKFEQLGMMNEPVADFVTPTIAGGKLYLRLKDTVACYDLTAK